MSSMPRTTEDTHIYFPKKVLAELRKWAKINRRTVTAETIIAVEKHVEQMRMENGSKAKGGVK